MKKYSGIGSRRTPSLALHQIQTLALQLANEGWCLRSGGADGADSAFERGAIEGNGNTEIFIPWRGFNNNTSPLYTIPTLATEIAAKFHPAWNMLRPPVKKLMARNVQQILGRNCDDPVDCVICYTPDGCEDGTLTTSKTGGTGQALRIATFFEIPIYNLECRDIEDIYNILENL